MCESLGNQLCNLRQIFESSRQNVSFPNCSFSRKLQLLTAYNRRENMVKSRGIKKRTIRGKKRKGFDGFKQRKDDVVNGNVNNAVNTVNTQKMTKTLL